MRDILDALRGWHGAGEPLALATVVDVRRSAPRQPGAGMAVSQHGEVVGSVSGGCVEGAVYQLAQQVLATGTPELAHYGYSDDEAFAVGLTCGGELDVFVERVAPGSSPPFDRLLADVAAERPVAVATVIDAPTDDDGGIAAAGGRPPEVGDVDAVGGRAPDAGGVGAAGGRAPVAGDVDVAGGERPAAVAGGGRRLPADASGVPRRGAKLLVGPDWHDGGLGTPGLDVAVIDDARGMLEQARTGERRYGAHGERRLDDVRVFVSSFAPRPRMFVFGAIDYAAAVARIGHFLGYHVTVCDARATFATSKRFPDADEVIVDWPHRYLQRVPVDQRSAICVLTHDPKFDVPLLEIALRSPAGYIGAMGSRRTHDERLARLRERGLSDDELGRLRSPIGLDLGARTPEETAVSVAAELIQHRWGGSGRPLRATTGRIHDRRTSG